MFTFIAEYIFSKTLDNSVSLYFKNADKKKIEDKLEEIELEIKDKYGNEMGYDTIISYIKKNKIFEKMFESTLNGHTDNNIEKIISKYNNAFRLEFFNKPSLYSTLDGILLFFKKELINFLNPFILTNESRFMLHQIESNNESSRNDIKEIKSSLQIVNKNNQESHSTSEIKKFYEDLRKSVGYNDKPDNNERLFLINFENNITLNDLLLLSKSIIKKYYILKTSKMVGSHIDSPAPYIYFHNVTKDLLDLLLDELYSNHFYPITGHPFLDCDFKLDNLVQKSTANTNFKVKIIVKYEHIQQIIDNLDSLRFPSNKYDIFHIYQTTKVPVARENSLNIFDLNTEDLPIFNKYFFNKY